MKIYLGLCSHMKLKEHKRFATMGMNQQTVHDICTFVVVFKNQGIESSSLFVLNAAHLMVGFDF